MGLFSVSNYAQGKLFLGVDLGFSSQDNGFNSGHETSEFVIAPSLGYWLSDNMAIVGRVGYASHDNKTDDVKTSGFGIGAELRYGWHLGDNTFLYLAPGARYGSEKLNLLVEMQRLLNFKLQSAQALITKLLTNGQLMLILVLWVILLKVLKLGML